MNGTISMISQGIIMLSEMECKRKLGFKVLGSGFRVSRVRRFVVKLSMNSAKRIEHGVEA
jgi:hypothetical protein